MCWVVLLWNFCFVIVDECYYYCGVFGLNVVMVLCCLLWLCVCYFVYLMVIFVSVIMVLLGVMVVDLIG